MIAHFEIKHDGSVRFFEAALLGCIPVIIADYIELPFEHQWLDYSQFTVKIREVRMRVN